MKSQYPARLYALTPAAGPGISSRLDPIRCVCTKDPEFHCVEHRQVSVFGDLPDMCGHGRRL